MPTELGTLKARRALAVRHHGADSPQAKEAADKLAAERNTRYIESLLATAPEFSPEQKARLAELLRPAREAITTARLTKLDDVARQAARKAARETRQAEQIDSDGAA